MEIKTFTGNKIYEIAACLYYFQKITTISLSDYRYQFSVILKTRKTCKKSMVYSLRMDKLQHFLTDADYMTNV